MLETLQAEAKKREDWTHYAEYCRARICGKRDEAHKHLKSFIHAAATWNFSQRQEFVIWLLEHLEIYPITPQCPAFDEPFLSSFLSPVLKEWADQKQEMDARPYRWLGMFFSDEHTDEYLLRAIGVDPREQLARVVFLGRVFDRLMGAAEVASDELNIASTLIQGIEDEPTSDYWRSLMDKQLRSMRTTSDAKSLRDIK